MVYRVVSTKLTEDEHTALLDLCGQQGVTPSAFTRSVILERLKADSPESSTDKEKEQKVKQEEPIRMEEKDEPNALSQLALLAKKFAESKQASVPTTRSQCSLTKTTWCCR